MVVAKAGDINKVRDFLAQGEDPEQFGLYGCSTLRVASEFGHVDVVRLLLQHNAEVNSRDVFLNMPLLSAVWNGHKDVVETLLEHGADTKTNNSG